jgi:hypothetical protein
MLSGKDWVVRPRTLDLAVANVIRREEGYRRGSAGGNTLVAKGKDILPPGDIERTDQMHGNGPREILRGRLVSWQDLS